MYKRKMDTKLRKMDEKFKERIQLVLIKSEY